MRFKRAIPFISPVLLFALLQLFMRYFTYAPWFGLAVIILLVLSIRFVSRYSFFSVRFGLYLTVPLLLAFSTGLFISLIEFPTIQHTLIIIVSLLLGLFLENVYLLHFERDKYHQLSIENVTGYMNLLSFFFFSIAFYGLSTLVGVQLWVLTIALIVVLSLIILQALWVANLPRVRAYLYLLVLNLIIVQVFWALSFLPTNFYLSGFLLTITYYFCWGISKINLLDILSTKVLKRYILISSLAVILVILTASWI